MTPTPPKIDAVYREYADALLRHHDLLSSNEDGGDEVQRVEDLLDTLWEKLDEPQQRSLRGMSSDLNWIRRRGEPPPRGRADSEVSETELRELEFAQKAEDWHAILYHLRMCAPKLAPDILAYSRATCYYKLDFQRIAVAATDLTVELGRGESRVARLAFDVLIRLAPGMAFIRANEIVSSASAYPPVVVAQSIGYVLDTLGADAASINFDALAEMLRGAHRRLDSSPSLSDRALFFQLAGDEMQSFGLDEEARELYEEGLRLDPQNQAMLAGLGKALYENDTARAVTLLRDAVLLKAPFIKPYMYLALYHLNRREFNLAYGYAKQALDYARNDRAKAAMLEMMAISASELKFPAEPVLRMFTEAARLAPDSTRIASNLKAFQESLDGREAKTEWEYQEDKAAFDVREFTMTTSMQEPEFAR